MKNTRFVAAAVAVVAAGTLAWGAGIWPTLPIVGQPSFCASFVSGVSSPANAPYLQVPGSTQGTGSGICGQTVPAGPTSLTGNELVPMDTGLAGGAPPQTVTAPTGLLTAGSGSSDDVNALIGTDFGQALWQRGTTPLSAATPSSATMGADGWFNIEIPATSGGALETITVSKQTGATDIPSNSLASARIQRVASQTAVATVCTGQLVPASDSQNFLGKTAIFAVDLFAGANFSPANGFVNMIIAVHSAADVTAAAANGQGTNTATFASSNTLGTAPVQNITNYTELVNTPMGITATWTRYSVAALVPTNIPGTATQITGIGVKLCWTPAGTAGTSDFIEFDKAQLEGRSGSSVGFSRYVHNTLAQEYALETARYYQITEGGSGTPIYATGYFPVTNIADVMVQFPTLQRITPVVSPITAGGFKFMAAGSATAPSAIGGGGANSVTPRTALVVGTGMTAGTAGQGTLMTGNAGTGVLGFSAEP